jgi:hypothetical protein
VLEVSFVGVRRHTIAGAGNLDLNGTLHD